jgi:hypothetical protein
VLSFPTGKHDDVVDALGLIRQLLDHMIPGERPLPPSQARPGTTFPGPDDWDAALAGYGWPVRRYSLDRFLVDSRALLLNGHAKTGSLG